MGINFKYTARVVCEYENAAENRYCCASDTFEGDPEAAKLEEFGGEAVRHFRSRGWVCCRPGNGLHNLCPNHADTPEPKATKKTKAATKTRTGVTIPATLRRFATYIDDISDERGDGDGYWVYLVPGWICDEVHCVHEDTIRECAKAMRCIERCTAPNCCQPAKEEG